MNRTGYPAAGVELLDIETSFPEAVLRRNKDVSVRG